jgi:hypothetical protein
VRAPSINGSVAALRFFFTVTLDRPEMARYPYGQKIDTVEKTVSSPFPA